MNLNSTVLITNNSLIGNKILKNAYSIKRSHMKLNVAMFCSNKIKTLMFAELQSYIFVDNLTLNNNHFTGAAYNISGKSKLETTNSEISQNNSTFFFLKMTSNSTAIFRNNTLIKNSFLLALYYLNKASTIQLINVAFIRNRKMKNLLEMVSNSNSIIQNNIAIENNVSWTVYYLNNMSTIHLNKIAFTRNRLMKSLLVMVSSSSAQKPE